MLPMAYWRYVTKTPVGAAWYTAGNLLALRILTGQPEPRRAHRRARAGERGRGHAVRAPGRPRTAPPGFSLYPAQAVTDARVADPERRRRDAADRVGPSSMRALRARRRGSGARRRDRLRWRVATASRARRSSPGRSGSVPASGCRRSARRRAARRVDRSPRLPPRPVARADRRPPRDLRATRHADHSRAHRSGRRAAAATRCARSAPTGLIVADRPGLTLGDLFAVWGQPLTQRRLAGFRGPVAAFVGGTAGRRRRSAHPDTPSFADRGRGLGIRAAARPLRLPAGQPERATRALRLLCARRARGRARRAAARRARARRSFRRSHPRRRSTSARSSPPAPVRAHKPVEVSFHIVLPSGKTLTQVPHGSRSAHRRAPDPRARRPVGDRPPPPEDPARWHGAPVDHLPEAGQVPRAGRRVPGRARHAAARELPADRRARPCTGAARPVPAAAVQPGGHGRRLPGADREDAAHLGVPTVVRDDPDHRREGALAASRSRGTARSRTRSSSGPARSPTSTRTSARRTRPGCASLVGGKALTARGTANGVLHVGILLPQSGRWRLFLQFQVEGPRS